MTKYNSIKDINHQARQIIPEYIDLLELLERVNPCDQAYDLRDKTLVMSYKLKLNLFNFFGGLSLYKKTRIVGLPISLCEKGYYGSMEDATNILKEKKGLTLILNGDKDLGSQWQTLSTFVFHNKYRTFDDYINNLRSPYRRRILKALAKRDKMIIRKINNKDFNNFHYNLYKDVGGRSQNPLETLSIDFFKSYEADIYELVDKNTSKILAFFQLKEFGDSLYFFFCGFSKEDIKEYDIYNNILIKIVEIGIERKIKTINFGQTSEESKLKIGCKEEKKYLSIYHRNIILHKFLTLLLPLFSYKPYNINHNVFKKE